MKTRHCLKARVPHLGPITVVVVVLIMGTLLEAQAQRPRPGRAARGRAAETEEKKPEKKPEEKKEESSESEKKKDEPVTAIVGGDVHTVSRGVVRDGTVLIRGDKILEVGQDVEVPEGATVIDASGKHVTPGFIAMNMSGIALRFAGSGNDQPADSLDPFDQDIKRALGVGITAGCVQIRGGRATSRRREPGERFLGLEPALDQLDRERDDRDFGDTETGVCPCCGLAILPTEPITPTRATQPQIQRQLVVKMSYGELDPMIASETPVYGMSIGALTGSLNRHTWRQTIDKARTYLEDQRKHEEAVKSGKKDQPPRKTVSDELIQLVKKEIYLRVDARSVDQIRDMIALARELDYKLMLDDVTEGWVVAEELSEAGVPVVITPRSRRSPRRGQEDRTGSSIESTGIFQRAGVPFAVSTLSSSISLNGLAGRDLTSLPLEAAFAVRGGADEKTALAALTIVPAQMLGLEDQLGSIERDKTADLLILNGPPLDYRSYVDVALVNGKVRYRRAKDRVYPLVDH